MIINIRRLIPQAGFGNPIHIGLSGEGLSGDKVRVMSASQARKEPMNVSPSRPNALGRRGFFVGSTGSLAALLMGLSPSAPASTAGSPLLPGWSLPGLNTPSVWEPRNGNGWLYLDFWASWCGPCRLSFPWMNGVHERWGSRGLRVVAVNVDRRREDALQFLRANPARFEVAFDAEGDLARRLAVKTMPTSLLVAPDGRILHRHEGFTASLGQQAEETIRSTLTRVAS